MLKLLSSLSRIAEGANALADALFGLAQTANQANAVVREKLALDEPAERPALVEPAEEPARNGRGKRVS